MAAQDLTAVRLREVLHYDPLTGSFHWAVTLGSRAVAGTKLVGTLRPDGYLSVRIERQFQFLHRLAWLHVHGEWPKHSIDHIDGDKQNNRIANLRDVTHHVNMQNMRRARRNSKSGLMGAAQKKDGRFQSLIRINGRLKHLGMFATAEDAHEAYLRAKRLHHEGCTI